jgi:AcrR family transcriptional regulator
MPRNKREVAPDVKRAEILAAALEAFCCRGYEGTSMASLAESIGVSQNTISWYFTNKDRLLIALVEAQLQVARAEYSRLQASSISDRLQWILTYIQGLGPLINIVHGRVPASQEVRAWHDGLHQRILIFFRAQLMERGATPAQADVFTQSALFVFEGIVTHPQDLVNVEKVMYFLASSVESALGANGGPSDDPGHESSSIHLPGT